MYSKAEIKAVEAQIEALQNQINAAMEQQDNLDNIPLIQELSYLQDNARKTLKTLHLLAEFQSIHFPGSLSVCLVFFYSMLKTFLLAYT